MVKKLRLIFLVVLFCLFALNVPTEASDRAGFYIGIKPGVYFPQGDIVDVPDYDTDPGFGMEIPIGYRFNETFGTELSLGWYQTDIPQTLKIYPITLDLILMKPLGDFTPYIRGGGGWYWAQVDSFFGGDESDSAFGFQAGIGLTYKNFGLEGRYINSTPTIQGVDLKLDGFLLNLAVTFP